MFSYPTLRISLISLFFFLLFVLQKVAQKVPIEELDKDGFFPRDEREFGEPTVPNIGEDALGRPRKSQNDIHDRPPGFLTQVSMLVRRDMKYIRRDRTVTMARVIQATLLATLIGMIFFNVGQSSTASLVNLHSQFGGIVLVSVIVMMGPAQAALMAFPDERPVFLREYTTNHYSVVAYFLSRLMMECILGAVQCLVIVSSMNGQNMKNTTVIHCGSILRLPLIASFFDRCRLPSI